jgi:hypothetical protein
MQGAEEESGMRGGAQSSELAGRWEKGRKLK